MDTSNAISSMWAELQQNNRLPKSQLLSGCASELRELMHQIDIMVETKKSAWRSERDTLRAELATRANHSALLQQTQAELSHVRAQLASSTHVQNNVTEQYEHQLAGLRQEVSSMKTDYEKYHKKCSRQVKETQRSKEKALSELEVQKSEVNRLNAKLDEYRDGWRTSEVNKRSQERHGEGLESQLRTMTEKYELLQQQSIDYQSQIDRRRDLLETTEASLRSKVTQLESKLERCRETLSTQDSQLSRSKALLDDTLAAQKKAIEDKECIEQDLHAAQQTIQKLDANLAEERSSNQMREHTSTTDLQISRLTHEITELQQALTNSEQTAQTLKKDHNKQLCHLQDDLVQAKCEIKKSRKSDHMKSTEIHKLKDALSDSRQQCNELQVQLDFKDRHLEAIKQRAQQGSNEHSRLSPDVEHANGHSQDHCEVSQDTCTVEPADYQQQVAALHMSISEHEHQLNKRSAQLQVANSQLGALRTENHHLRHAMMANTRPSEEASVDITSQQRIDELRNAYDNSLQALEKQNQQLQVDVTELQEKLNESDKWHHQVDASHITEMGDAARENSDPNSDQLDEVAALQDQLSVTVADYESRLSDLQQQMSHMASQVETRDHSLKRLGLENQVMSNFVKGVDHIVQSPPNRDVTNPSTALLGDSLSVDSQPESFVLDDIDYDSTELATEQFLAEQGEWKNVLASKIDSHIDDLRTSSNAIIQKYAAR